MFMNSVTICTLICCNLIMTMHFCNANKDDKKQPNIVIILADDMGFNDVSIQGSNQIPTPNFDALAATGIKLNRMYVAPMCSPSRSSLMTGKYESNVGMQHFVISSNQPFGLPLHEKIMPQYLKEVGYRTYLIGKWHLGFFEEKYTPLHRGFDSHFGYLGPFIDYWNHSLKYPYADATSGFDMRKNFTVNWDTIGHYATDLFTEEAVRTIENHDQSNPMFMFLTHLAPHTANEYDPMQAPEDEIKKFDYIQDKDRRVYAAMVSRLDAGIGKVVKALDDNEMLDNTIILFMADNGAPIFGQHSNKGSNYPFKGQKDSPWEGAIRSAAAIWSKSLIQRQRVSNQVIHISDWLPTFAKLAGFDVKGHIDGKNVWSTLSQNKGSPRKEVLCHHDMLAPYMSYINGNYKYVNGTTYDGKYDEWLSSKSNSSEENNIFGENYAQAVLSSDAGQALFKYSFSNIESEGNEIGYRGMTITEINELRRSSEITCNGFERPAKDSPYYCNATVSPCLFDLSTDPCEMRNLANERPDILAKLQDRVNYFGKIAKEPRNKPSDPRSDPANFGGIWTWWYDELRRMESSGMQLSTDRIVLTLFILCTSWMFLKRIQ